MQYQEYVVIPHLFGTSFVTKCQTQQPHGWTVQHQLGMSPYLYAALTWIIHAVPWIHVVLWVCVGKKVVIMGLGTWIATTVTTQLDYCLFLRCAHLWRGVACFLLQWYNLAWVEFIYITSTTMAFHIQKCAASSSNRREMNLRDLSSCTLFPPLIQWTTHYRHHITNLHAI